MNKFPNQNELKRATKKMQQKVSTGKPAASRSKKKNLLEPELRCPMCRKKAFSVQNKLLVGFYNFRAGTYSYQRCKHCDCPLIVSWKSLLLAGIPMWIGLISMTVFGESLFLFLAGIAGVLFVHTFISPLKICPE